MTEKRRAQGTFEYMLLLGGVLLVVVLAMLLLTNTFSAVGKNTEIYAKVASGGVKPVTTVTEARSAFTANFPEYADGQITAVVEEAGQFGVSASKSSTASTPAGTRTFYTTTVAYINKMTGAIDEAVVTT